MGSLATCALIDYQAAEWARFRFLSSRLACEYCGIFLGHFVTEVLTNGSKPSGTFPQVSRQAEGEAWDG